MSILTFRHSSMLCYFGSVPIHIPSMSVGGSIWYNMTINCKQTAKNFCRKNTPEPSLCLPKDEQESMANFTHSQRRWFVSFTVWWKVMAVLKCVKPEAELPGWLYGVGCTMCILCSGNTCIWYGLHNVHLMQWQYMYMVWAAHYASYAVAIHVCGMGCTICILCSGNTCIWYGLHNVHLMQWQYLYMPTSFNRSTECSWAQQS